MDLAVTVVVIAAILLQTTIGERILNINDLIDVTQTKLNKYNLNLSSNNHQDRQINKRTNK